MLRTDKTGQARRLSYAWDDRVLGVRYPNIGSSWPGVAAVEEETCVLHSAACAALR